MVLSIYCLLITTSLQKSFKDKNLLQRLGYWFYFADADQQSFLVQNSITTKNDNTICISLKIKDLANTDLNLQINNHIWYIIQ